MLIEKFVVPSSELSDVGLQSIEMNRLGRFVALAGKNGAGKSRLLNKLEQYASQRNTYIGNLANIDSNIQGHLNAIQGNPHDHPSQPAWKNQLKDLQHQRTLATARILSPASASFGLLRFVPKVLNLADPRNQNKATIKSHSDQAKNPGLSGYEHFCFSYIQTIQNREWEATHQRSTHDKDVVKEAQAEYEKLVSLIELFLKTRLDRSIDADATLFGKPLAEAGLSDGQKVLIQLAVALHAQKGKLDNTVFILDEPENHLHPSALIEFLDTVSKVATNAQFWIATHSVPLLAHIAQEEPMSIWYIEDGKVNNAGSKPEQVLRGLLGNDEQIANLNAFTSLPAQFASISYAAECLVEPSTVGSGAGDPQVAQISGILNSAASPVSLLDFGAGKSRLLSGLVEIAANKNISFADNISYFAFDPSPDDKEDSLSVIKSTFGDEANRHFSNLEEFFSHKDDSSIDVVVMCNVLHEIPPNDWLKIFNEHSLIWRALKESGYLLIVEDQRIPTGEKAHKYGFLVLDTPHLRTLFAVTEKEISEGLFQPFDHRGDGRLKAHRISKQLLNRLKPETRKRAIVQLRESAKEQITALRTAEPNYRNGQMHGFWTQEFANASLWLDEQ